MTITVKGKRGGSRPNSGKKSVDGNSKGTKMVLVYLHEDEKAFFKDLGSGYLSPGIRIAKRLLEEYRKENPYISIKTLDTKD